MHIYSFKKDPDKQYDENKRKMAKQKCMMIYLVVAYILYQAYGIVDTKLTGETTMTWFGVVAGAGILIVGSLTVAVFATLKMGKELAESEIRIEEQTAEQTKETIEEQQAAEQTKETVAEQSEKEKAACEKQEMENGHSDKKSS